MISNTPGMFYVPGEPEIVTEVREYILSKFRDLVFDEGPHVYTLNGKTLPSVTTVLGQYEEPFDTENVARGYAKRHPEKTAEGWKSEWAFKNKMSTVTGTLVHEYGESLAYVLNGNPNLITESCHSKYIRDSNWLIPTRPKEEAILKYWKDMRKIPGIYFLLAEAKLFTNINPRYQLKQQLAGTTDILLYYIDPNNGMEGIMIHDYKTNAELTKEYARSKNKYMLKPFDNYIAEPLSIYTAQLSTYQIPLVDIGLNVIDRRLIWLKPDGTYEKIFVPDISETIRQNL